MLAERHGRRGSQATWSPRLPLPAVRPAAYGPCAESPLLICPGGWLSTAKYLSWARTPARQDCLMGVQLGFMGVQLGCKVIWAGLRGRSWGARTPGQQREDVTVLSR